jgi:hypothetical protein
MIVAAVNNTPAPPAAAADPEPPLDPKDFMVQNVEGQVILREPGASHIKECLTAYNLHLSLDSFFRDEDCQQKHLHPALGVTGKIRGQGFILDGCKNCDIYLLDHLAQVTIDECVDCRIIMGPCESRWAPTHRELISSIFSHDPKRMTVQDN